MATDYLEKLKEHHNITLQWDVVVSYGLEEINKVLAAAHAKPDSIHSLPRITCQVIGTDIFGNQYTIDYHFVLAAPKIQITYKHNVGHTCELTFPVGKSTATAENGSDKISQTIEDGIYELVVGGLEIATASGDSGPTTPEDTPFTFDKRSKEDGVVVIDLPASKALSVNVEDRRKRTPENKPSFVEAHKASIGLALAERLRTHHKGIRLELARVSPSSPPPGAVELKPKSFMFVVLDKPLVGPAVLSLLIQTRGTNNGVRDETRGWKWEKLWAEDIGYPPLYPGHTASIIIKKDVLYDEMIGPSIEDQNMTSFLSPTTGGLTIELTTGQKLHHKRYLENNSGCTPLVCVYDRKEISAINADPDPVHITLTSEEGVTQCLGRGNFSYHFTWETTKGSESRPISRAGGVTVVNKLRDGLGTVKSNADDYTFSLEFSIEKKSWTQDFQPDSQSFWEEFAGGRAEVPDWAKELAVAVRDLRVDCGDLYHFVVTNLLTPSQKVINIDGELGLQIVGDAYLGGDVVPVSDKLARMRSGR